MTAPNPADREVMRQDKDIQLLQEAGLNIGYLAMNGQKPPPSTNWKCANPSPWLSTAMQYLRKSIRARARGPRANIRAVYQLYDLIGGMRYL